MDFNYSQEQYLMQDSALALFREIGGPPAARRAYAEGAGVARTLLPRLAEQGLLGGPLSGDFGGSELSVLDFALVFEAAGRTLLPFPLAETFVAGTVLNALASDGQKHRHLENINAGQTLASVAWGATDKGVGFTGVEALTEGGVMRLYGRRTGVPFADAADLLLVPVESKTGGGRLVALVNPHRDGMAIRRLESLDGSAPLSVVDFQGYELADDDQIWDGEPAWTLSVNIGRVAYAQEALGVAEQVFADTVEYVKVREQFGFPVGRFQAVKHTAADDFLLVESARVANRYAALMATEASVDAPLHIMMAKAYSGDMARRVTSDAIQLHGGIGYTWDADVHLFFKRAWRLASQLGTPVALREEMAVRVIDARRHAG
jgi:hypothetical protein